MIFFNELIDMSRRLLGGFCDHILNQRKLVGHKPRIFKRQLNMTNSLIYLGMLIFASTSFASPPTELLSFEEGTKITLTWRAPADTQIIGYGVYRGSDPNTLVKIATVGASTPGEWNGTPPSTVFTDIGVGSFSSYFYRVTAIDTSGVESGYSPVTATCIHQLSTTYHSDGIATQAVVGDFNGDGKPDLALGFPYAVNKGKTSGQVVIYFGGTGRRQTVITLNGEADQDKFGKSLAVADLNKDGFDDLAVGAPGFDDPAEIQSGFGNGGKVYIYAGGATFGTTTVQTVLGRKVYSATGVYLDGESLGETLTLAGDINGDGYPDIAVGAPMGGFDRSGGVYILYGAMPIGTSRTEVRGALGWDELGTGLAAAGDNSGDGFQDVWASFATGLYSVRKGQPGVYLITGGATPRLNRLYPGGPSFTAVDFDGDGFTDPAVINSNDITVFNGSPTGGTTPLAAFTPWSARVFPAKDIDGDGRGEVVGDGARIHFGHNGLPRTPYIGLPVNYSIIGVADVNSDGIQEAILEAGAKVYLAPLNPFLGQPKITITAGIDNSLVTAASMTVTGNISGGPTLLLVGGKETTVGADGSFSADVQLHDGKNFVEVITTGIIGQVVKRYISVTAITTPLTVSITTPANGSILNTNPATVQGSVSDPNAQVVVNGTAATVSGTSWNAVVSLANGQQNITATATDSYNRSVNDFIVVTLNTEPPTGTILGTVTDGIGAPLSTASISVTDISSALHTTQSDLQGRYSLLKIPAGAFSALFNKPGYVGKSILGSLDANQTLDLSAQLQPAPSLQIAISTPQSGALFHTPQAVVTGTVTNSASVTVNGVSAAVADGSFTATAPLTLGNGQITATAQDQYEQAAVASIPVLYLPGPLLTAAVAVPVSAGSVKVTWRTDQPATGVVEYGAGSDYGAQIVQPVAGLDHAVTITGLTPGNSYHLRVSATNGDGFTTTGSDIVATLPLFSARFIEDRGAVAVLEVEGGYDAKDADGSFNSQPRQAIGREYFRTHGDLDFLVFLSTFDYSMLEPTSTGFYTAVKNDVQGIGAALFDGDTLFGSSGKLQGAIDLGNVTALATNPYGAKLDETVATLNHEIGHRWGAYVRFKNADGTLNMALLGKDSSHWSYLLDSTGSLMYGNGWKDNGNGTFTSTAAMSGYSPLDLYLMGMIPKEQVSPMLLIDNPAIDKMQLPQLGVTVSGTAKTVTIDDIIAAEGARVPDAASSPKQFKVGFVLLTRPGESSAAAAAAIETVRSAWAGRFAELTRGAGGISDVPASLTVSIAAPADNATITGPDVTVSGTVINSSGAETGITVNGIPATVSGSRFIVNHVSLQEGANTLTITATDVNGLTTTATRSVTGQAGHYIRITSNIDSGTGPLDISLRLDGSFVISNPTVSIAGPVSVSPTPGTSPNEFTAMLTVEGTYTITASAVGPDGQMYGDSVTVTVVSKAQLETLLQEKWTRMKEKIAASDIDGTLGFIANRPQAKYREFFTALGAQFPLLNDYLKTIELVYSSSGFAKGRLFRDKTIAGQVHTIEYVVYFVRENGVWKVAQF